MWELVLAAKNQPTKNNMFPICTTKEAFDAQLARRRLEGIAVDVHENISKFAERFWNDSIQPFSGFANQDYIPEFDMLIAINYKNGTELFTWRKNKVLHVRTNSACVGAGEMHIHPMLRDLQDLQSNLEAMLFYGIRILRHAKRLVQSVGGQTEAMALDDDGLTTIYGRTTVKKIEDMELNLDQLVHKWIYLSISNITQKFSGVDKNVEGFMHQLPNILISYRDQYKKILNEAFTKEPIATDSAEESPG